MKPTPILFISDSPELPTGLARITKDIACLTSTLPQFRVGVLGRGGHGSSQLPFAQYNFDTSAQWGEYHIESVWQDFAGRDKARGVVMTIWDISRLGWFANPHMGGGLERFLRGGWFSKWGYIPVDSYGVGGRLTGRCVPTLRGYDRLLAYTLFGKQVLEDTLGVQAGAEELDWLPHGINTSVFASRDRIAGRLTLGVDAGDVLVGCVMTNQARKDWAVAMGAVARLKERMLNRRVKLWAHVDVVERHWNLHALIEDMGLQDSVRVTLAGEYSSEQLSYMYSACDVTMLPSLGEGWGFPITESLACGVPCVHGNYGGGVEQIPERAWLVAPYAERLDGLWNCVRPVWRPDDWAGTLQHVVEDAEVRGEEMRESCASSVQHLEWSRLWPSAWSKWMLKGIGQ